MKGCMYSSAKYKAWNEGIITSRNNPRTRSRECARCHAPIIRYVQGRSQESYTVETPLMVYPVATGIMQTEMQVWSLDNSW